MARKTCSKGHIYDSAIYGDNCPFCPSKSGTGTGVTGFGDTGGTEVNQGTQAGGAVTHGPTISMHPGGGIGGGTVIRPAGGGTGTLSVKKMVGLLVTYNTNPAGQVFNIYEGRNYIGRTDTDIRIQGDSQVSEKHFSILYRPADGKFKFKDEQSSNGTFLNEILTDEGELHTFDVIRIGSTQLIFIAIPQIQETNEAKYPFEL